MPQIVPLRGGIGAEKSIWTALIDTSCFPKFSHPGKNMGGTAWKCSPANGKLAYISGQAGNSLNQLNLYWEVDAWDSSCLGVMHILRNHFGGVPRDPPPPM